MRAFRTWLRDIVRKPPALFPYVALFHLFLLVYITWLYHAEPFPSVSWLQPLWMLGYTICWLFVCDLRKWAAYGYLLLTAVNLSLQFFVHDPVQKDLLVSPLLLIDVAFCFFVLFFFRRFR